MNDIKSLGRIAPITDAEASRLISPGVMADLAARITETPAGAGLAGTGPAGTGPAGAGPAGRRPASWARRSARRWLIAGSAAGGLAAAAIAVTSLDSPAGQPATRHHPKPVAGATVAAQVLSFTKDGGYIDVIVRDPLADPARYREEFRAHGLDITLKLVPASPSIVGTLIYMDGALTPITAKGKCFTGGGGDMCPVGVRVPLDYKDPANLVFGRAARPGEQYESTADASAPGEALHGLKITGQRVSTVLAWLKQRHQTVVQFRGPSTLAPVKKPSQGVIGVRGKDNFLRPDQVPGTWYVYEVLPWAPGQVVLFVGSTPTAHQGPPVPGTPAPTATASAG